MKTAILALAAFLGLATAASAQVLVTEIHYHPVEEASFNADGTPFLQLTNDVHEFVEIQNTGATSIDVGGWTLAGGVGFTFPTNTILDSGKFCVVARDPARLAAVYALQPAEVLGPYSGHLGNGSDTVRIRDLAGNLVDSVSYDSRFPWAQSADALGAQDRFTGLSATNFQYKGRSLQRVSTSWPSSDPANWLASPLSGPTPGGPQAMTRTIPKPVVVAFSAAQQVDGATIVRSNNAVTVLCTCSATNGLSAVTLEYFVDDINSTTEVRTSVAMASLGNARYTATIPGQTNRSIVRYRFKADRGDGAEVMSPRADDPQIAPVGASGVLEAWHGYFVTPIRTTTKPAVYDVFVSTASLSTMSKNVTQSPNRVTSGSATGLPRDIPYVAATAPQWNGTVPGVLAWGGQVWDIHIRYHGSKYHRAPSNLSYKLHFPEHHLLHNQSSWFETLHGTEFIEAQQLNRLLGLPSSRMRQVDWYFNTSANAVHAEQGEYAGEMLDAYHELQQQLNLGTPKEDSGELYKNVGNRDPSQNNVEGPYTRGDIAPLAANTGWSQLKRYEWTFSLQNHGWKGSKPLRDLIEGMWTARGDTPATHNFSTNAAKLAATRAWFTNNWDMDTTLTSMALLEWMSIWDDAAQNHFFWRRANGKWVRLGWDYDSVMSTGAGGLGGGSSQTIYGGEYGAPAVFDGVNWWKDTFYKCFRTEYNQRLWELNNSFLDSTNLAALGFTRANTFAASRRTYVNTQLASLGTYYKPNRPFNVYPGNGVAIVGATNLVCSAYNHSRSTPHMATRWEIRSATGNYEEPVLRLTSTNNLTSRPIPFDQLTYGQTYYWRVTTIDATGHPSVVSPETKFSWGTSSATAGTLVMNEVLAYNRNTVQNGSEFPDYIELRNNTSADLSLAGFTLTDNPANQAKFTFPENAAVPAGGHLLLWCDKDSSAPGIHTGFGLNEEGETLVLMSGTNIIDSVTFGPQAPDVSIGRIVSGTGGWQANAPTPGTANSARKLGSAVNLRLNEWMANPVYGNEWFELYNTDAEVVPLSGLFLSDTPSAPTLTPIPPLSFIEGHGYTRFWADGHSSGGSHCNFKLSKSGESLVLTAANGVSTIDTVTFSAQARDVSQGRLPDGAASLASFPGTASPGYANWLPSPVRINEVLAHAASPFEDAIELCNTGTTAVDIGGWWLSDDLLEPMKFQIPAGTILPAGGFAVFYEKAIGSGAVPFALSLRGDEVRLSAVDPAGTLTGYGSLVRFGASPANVPFGRVEATGLGPSSGGAEFWALTSHSFGQDKPASVALFRAGAGATNAPPEIGPVIINEIHYHPVDPADGSDDVLDEFVELWNVSDSDVNLDGWRLKGDSEFVFPSGTVLPRNGYALVLSFNPTNETALIAFRTSNNIPVSTLIVGPYSESLANSTHDVEIARPVQLDGSTAYVLVDKVEFRDVAPWPVAADGSGASLQRVSSTVIGNTAANWLPASPTPGSVNEGAASQVLAITTPVVLPGAVTGLPYSTKLEAKAGTPPYSWSVTGNSITGLTLSSEGLLSGTPQPVGQGTIGVTVTDASGSTARQAFVVEVAATALTITSTSPLQQATLNAAYEMPFVANGGTAPYAWSQTDGTLPGGLTLNGAGILSGIPTNTGVYAFSVLAADSGGLTATRSFVLAVPVLPLVITSQAIMVDADQSAPYAQALTGAGGVPPYAWSLSAGSLPPGLLLSSSGDITGEPTADGTFSFTAQLTDVAGAKVPRTFTLRVRSPYLALTTIALPDANVGDAYAKSIAAEGGLPPYTWTLAGGALPDGLTLGATGSVSGRATTAGTFSFVVQVTDGAGASVSALFTIQIYANAPVLAFWDWSLGAVQWVISGDTGADYTIEASTDLVTWAPVFTNRAAATPFLWQDSGGTNSVRFYRVLLGP